MADAQEDSTGAPEATEEAQAVEETAPTEEAQEQEAAPEEADATEEAAPPGEEEAQAEGTVEGEEEPPPEEQQEDKPEEEGEEQAVEGEPAEGEGAEATSEQQEGDAAGEEAPAGEEAAAVEGAEQPVEGAEPAEPAEPTAEPAEGEEQGEGVPEPGQDEESAPLEGEGEGQETAEAKEGEEQAEGEGAEKEEEEGEEEKKEGEEGEGEGEEKKEDEESKEKEEISPEETEHEIKADDLTERTESPVAVGEKLSRGATPDLTDGAAHVEHERLEATTPDRLDEEGHEVERVMREQAMVEEEDEEMEEPEFNREQLIEKYHEALADREQLQSLNYALQHRLAEYFRKKKADERQDYDKNVTDQEQRYLKYMSQLEDLRRQDEMEKENFEAQIQDAKMKCQEKKERVDHERKKFMEFKNQVARNAINSRSGKPIPPKDIEQYMVNEVRKEQEVIVVRLENIKLKNKLKKKEQQLKSKEELAEGLHLIDFEQLKIENQTYNEKIEERNEELLKLRKKITGTVQVLTHLKEKLQFVQGENSEQNNQLKEVEASLAQSRDILSRTKQARDALRIDNQKLRQNCGLLGNEALLRDFEERKDEGDDLRAKLEQLKMRHAELTLHCNQVRRKIDQAKQSTA